MSELSEPTVAEIVKLYLAHCQANGVHGEAARIQREYNLGEFVKALGHLKATECKPFHLTDWIASRPTIRSVATKRANAVQVNACFNWAVNEERIPRNPFKKVKFPEAPPRPALTDEQLEDVFAAATEPFGRTVRFLRLTGARLSEMCRAQWPDFDLEKGLWRIAIHKAMRYSQKARIVPLTSEAVDLLKSIRDKQPQDYLAHVFLNSRGAPWNKSTLGQAMRRMRYRGQVSTDASLHGLRHAFAISAVTNGAPLKLVAEALGHLTTQITERYYAQVSTQFEAIRSAADLAKPKIA